MVKINYNSWYFAILRIVIAQDWMITIIMVVVGIQRTGQEKSNQHTLVLLPFCPVVVAEMCGSAHPEILLQTTYQSCHCWYSFWGIQFGRWPVTSPFVQLHSDHAAVLLGLSPSTPASTTLNSYSNKTIFFINDALPGRSLVGVVSVVGILATWNRSTFAVNQIIMHLEWKVFAVNIISQIILTNVTTWHYHITIQTLHIWGKISNITIGQAVVYNLPLIDGVSSFSQEKQVFLIVKILDCCKL